MHNFSGIAFPNAKLSLTLQTGEKKEIIWPMLFTHFGISWPATFVLSAYSSFEQIDKGNPLKVSFASDSEKTKEFWNSFLLTQAQENPRKKISTILHTSFPDRMIDGINTHIFWWKLEWQMGLCSKELRLSLAEYLWWWWICLLYTSRCV